MRLYGYDDYKQYVRDWVAAKGRRGGYREIALALRVQSSMISQVFKGELNLSAEHTLILAEILGLEGADRDFFLCLVLRDRAGTIKLKSYYQIQIDHLRSSKINQTTDPMKPDTIHGGNGISPEGQDGRAVVQDRTLNHPGMVARGSGSDEPAR